MSRLDLTVYFFVVVDVVVMVNDCLKSFLCIAWYDTPNVSIEIMPLIMNTVRAYLCMSQLDDLVSDLQLKHQSPSTSTPPIATFSPTA